LGAFDVIIDIFLSAAPVFVFLAGFFGTAASVCLLPDFRSVGTIDAT
jgi:hypothetical protein